MIYCILIVALTISEISCVMMPWRALLKLNVSDLMSEFELSVAFFIAIIRDASSPVLFCKMVS